MSKRNPDLPKPTPRVISKQDLLDQLLLIDGNGYSRRRILALETKFRTRISNHVAALPIGSEPFSEFNTNPFVLMFYCKQQNYHSVCQIEHDILPAKIFSSMETSAGRMVQSIILPAFGWEDVQSSMHSSESVLDGRKIDSGLLRLATLKSGPRCLNDTQTKDIATDIVGFAEQWATEADVDHIDFTYGVLYGTQKQSNKKDWHILRNIVETLGTRFIIEPPVKKWHCSFRVRNIRVDVTIRIGTDWWGHLGGQTALVEVLVALIRACVVPSHITFPNHIYVISDLHEVISTDHVPSDFNVSILQRSQIEWLFFLAKHFCDKLVP